MHQFPLLFTPLQDCLWSRVDFAAVGMGAPDRSPATSNSMQVSSSFYIGKFATFTLNASGRSHIVTFVISCRGRGWFLNVAIFFQFNWNWYCVLYVLAVICFRLRVCSIASIDRLDIYGNLTCSATQNVFLEVVWTKKQRPCSNYLLWTTVALNLSQVLLFEAELPSLKCF